MTAQRRTFFVLLFSPLLFSLFLNCAEVAPPPGGEEDKRAPSIIQSSPNNGATLVPPGNEITFWFSEGVIRPTGSKPVFISPRQSRPPEIHWKSDRLTVRLAENFDSNQTYVLTIAPEITDWRRNKMDSSVTLAFSTGDKIDSGSISGYILSGGAAKGGILVGLYEMNSASTAISFDSVFPAYLSQSAADGSFKFRFLPPGQFVLIGFDDINRNERFNPHDEPFAVPDREINLGTTRLPENLYLELSPPASVEPKIVSAIVTADGLIKMRIDTKLRLDYLKENPNAIRFTSVSNSNKVHFAHAIYETHLDTSSVLTVYSQIIDSGTFNISLQIDSELAPIIYEGLSIGKLKDKNPPLVLEFLPADQQIFKKDAQLGLIFNEPIDAAKTTSGTFSLKKDTLESLNLVPRWSDPFHASFETGNLEEGMRYTLSLAEFEIADMAGNLLGDSIFTYDFAIISSDSLGSASGTVFVELVKKETAARHLTFTNVQTKQRFDLKVAGNNFTTDLPAGKYLLSGFLDENGNAIRDIGSVRPYTFAETFSKSSDTISVRARFETAGIEFRFK